MAETASKASRPSRVLLLALCAALVSAGAFFGWRYWGAGGARQSSDQQAPQPVPVQAARAETKDVPVFLNGLGLVQAFNTVTIRTRVDGEIQAINFDEGQIVNQGDLLLQIDPRPFQAALDQALAKKAQDEATLVSLKADLERTRQLSTRDFASKQQLDQQQAQVNALAAQIDADQAAIDNARTQLGYTTIRSPLTGRTGFRLVDRGNIVHAADANGVVEITQVEPITVVFTAPEDQLPEINRNQAVAPLRVIALSPNGKEPLAEGNLTLVNNQVDTASGTIRLKAQFDNKDHRLWPGLSVSTRLLLRTIKGAVTVPGTAVQRGPQGLFAYVIKPDLTVEVRPLQVGPINDVAVIETGLAAGDLVVTSGHYRLQPGAKVEVANSDAPKIAKQDP